MSVVASSRIASSTSLIISGSSADDPRAAAIAEAARRLVELRDRWLTPPEWVDLDPRTRPRLSQTPNPTPAAPLDELKNRTLTNLSNQRPQWLANAHANLDAAVAAAYGWPTDISDEDALRQLRQLRQLLQLNLARSA